MGAVAAPRLREALPPLLIAGGLGLAALGMLAGGGTALAGGAGAAALLLAAVAARAPYLRWETILAALVLVILWIPLRRYKLPGDAGFGLEPYRVLVALVLAGWLAALLVDARVRFRRSGLEWPMAWVILAAIMSILANPTRAATLQPAVLKAVTFLASFVVVFYLVVSVVRTRTAVDVIVRTLVAGGAVVAFFAVIEARIGWTPFTQLDRVMPFLVNDAGFEAGQDRGGAVRAVGSAEHPIALGAALVLLVPFAIYLVRFSTSRWWYVALGMLVLGALSTVSRTGILMLLVIGIVFLWLRFKESLRIAPVLLPVLIAAHLAIPGALGALHQAFFPEDGLIAEQQGMAGSCSSSGRVADIGPTIEEAAKKPLFGYGFGTRITTGPESNACILDNQWLHTLLDVGLFGVLAWFFLFRAVRRRFGRSAKDDDSPEGWMLAATTAAVLAFATGMLTFDAFGFSQVTFLLFIVLGVGAAVAANARDAAEPPSARRLPADASTAPATGR
jgi:hypothetical protein